MPLFSLPADYAGQTITIDIFDPGDIGGSGDVDINTLDPSGAVASAPPAATAVYDLGTSRTGGTPVLVGTPATATFKATVAGSRLYNGHWVEMQVPVPAGYNPASPVWSLQYVTPAGVTAADTLTVAVGLRGNPAHLLSS
jgi:hypothetical protein